MSATEGKIVYLIPEEPPASPYETYARIAIQVVSIGVTIAGGYMAYSIAKEVLSSLSADKKTKEVNRKKLAERLKRPELETMDFNDYEGRLLNDVLGPDELQVSFEDVGGLATQVEEVHDNIVLPIQLWTYSKSYDRIVPCPNGVLLYGAPGTGKTLIAKAIAKESGATFINIKASSIFDKFFGESDRLVTALFSLGKKLGPSIIFIDEVETLLRKRDGNISGNPALASLQSLLLTEWDGLSVERNEELKQQSANKSVISTPPVVVLGATNRPSDIDPAFLRRMPVQIQTKIPDLQARLEIFQAQLKNEKLSEDVDLEDLAEATEGYSGSDIKELIRIAHLQRIKEVKNSLKASIKNKGTSSSKGLKLTPQRDLNQRDFELALERTKMTGKSTPSYSILFPDI
jgi:SpoVK/Ycf46/Vps4 family AAA+-type ATPase